MFSTVQRQCFSISIVIPCYERYVFLPDALESVLRQTVQPQQIIVLDNASSHYRIRDVCAQYRGVQYIRNHSNVGMFGNWNLGLSLSLSTYTLILGDDDVLESTYVEEVEKVAIAHCQPDIIYSDYQQFNEKGTLPKAENIHAGILSGSDVRRLSACHGLFMPVLSASIKTDWFDRFPDEIHASNDWLWSVLLPRDTSVYGIPKVLLHYRKHNLSDSLNSLDVCSFSHMAIYQYLSAPAGGLGFSERCSACWRASQAFASLLWKWSLFSTIKYFSGTDNFYYRVFKTQSSRPIFLIMCSLSLVFYPLMAMHQKLRRSLLRLL